MKRVITDRQQIRSGLVSTMYRDGLTFIVLHRRYLNVLTRIPGIQYYIYLTVVSIANVLFLCFLSSVRHIPHPCYTSIDDVRFYI